MNKRKEKELVMDYGYYEEFRRKLDIKTAEFFF
jgi:hypothetical protein